MSEYEEGSYWAGFALGFFLGLIGLIIAIAIDKSETKRGAVTGFIISIVISVVAVGCVICNAGAALEGIIYNVTPIL